MNAYRMLTLAIAFPMLIAVSGCVSLPTSTENSALDRLKQPAANHARALAGDDPEAMRETGLVVLSLLEAYAGW